MTKFSLILLWAAAVCFSPSSHAEFRAEPEWTPNAVEAVDCKPALDRKDSDPVIVTHVTATFDEGTGEIESLSVIHERFSGEMRDRSEQYYQTALRRSEGRTSAWIWSGLDKKNRSHTTVGTLYHTAGGTWGYDEDHYAHGKLVYQSSSSCHHTGKAYAKTRGRVN